MSARRTSSTRAIRPVELSSHPIQPASEPPPPLVPREWHLRLDPLLLVATLGLVACSLVALNGATQNDIPGDPDYYVIRQAIYAGVGLVLMYARVAARLLAAARAALPDLRGDAGARSCRARDRQATRGAKSWIALPFFNFQPSELGKVLLVVTLRRLPGRPHAPDGPRHHGADHAARPDPDDARDGRAGPRLGAGLRRGHARAAVRRRRAVAALRRARQRWSRSPITLVLVVAPMAGVEVLKPYQVDRLTSFLHPSANPGQEGYQQQQALIAMGSGEKTGRGVANATQTSLNFLPEHHTDFIFAVIGETFGFAGCALVLSLYALLIWRGLHILTVAKNLYGALIAGGITVMLLFQLFVNIGMNVGIMPITGVTAPLLSFGGSSMLATFLALGLLHSVHAQARETAELKGRATVFQ